MGWLSDLFFPCSQARKPCKESSFFREDDSQTTAEEQQQKLSPIDPAILPQKPNKIVKKPCPQSTTTSSIRIVEYPDSESMLEDESMSMDEKSPQPESEPQPQTSCADSASVLSDDRTILMPEPDEEAFLLEMSKIEKDLAATSMNIPRRTSATTTRTSACLDGLFPVDTPITEQVIEEERESESEEEDTMEQDAAAAVAISSQEQEQSASETPNDETPKELQEPHGYQYQEKQPVPVPEPEKAQSQAKEYHLSTRLSRRRSLIEIFNLLRSSQHSTFKLNLDFSPRLYQNPLSPMSPSSSSSTTAFSPPMSPVSTISPLSPTLSDDTIKVSGIETACAVRIAGPKGVEEIVHQAGDINHEENPFRFH